MKIEIYKKEKDENIYFSYDSCKDNILNFENLKNFSKMILEQKKKGKEIVYEVESENELALYKSTVEDVIKSIKEDEELFNLYNEKTGSQQEESTNLENIE